MMLAPTMYATQAEDVASQTGSKDHLRKMFIGGLSAVTTEDSLRAFFGQWGEVVDAIVMRDPATKRSRGFGFISYSDISMVDKAQNARPHVIDGKAVDSKRALPRPAGGKSETGSSVKKIFVGGLKENHDEQSLTEHFSQFGNVVSVKILTDKTTGRKRGFAFVEFDDYDSVDKAVLHKNHTIKFVLVDVKKSVYKQELAKKLASQQNNDMYMTGGTAPGTPVPQMQQPGMPGHYQAPIAAYNPQQATAYAYPPAMAPGGNPATAAYNGWAGYVPNYSQPIAAASYGSYAAPPQNGAATWNTTAYAPSQATWQNGYGTPAAAPAPIATVPTAAPAAANGWNGNAAAAAAAAVVPQSFGDYQQSYNGGPQKAGSLQGNRMNPYQVSSATSYATTPGYVYASQNNVNISNVNATASPQQSSSTLPTTVSKGLNNLSTVNKTSRRPY